MCKEKDNRSKVRGYVRQAHSRTDQGISRSCAGSVAEMEGCMKGAVVINTETVG